MLKVEFSFNQIVFRGFTPHDIDMLRLLATTAACHEFYDITFRVNPDGCESSGIMPLEKKTVEESKNS